jgi:hypothetical protein
MSSVENGSMIAAEFVANESSAGIWSPAPQKKKGANVKAAAISKALGALCGMYQET